MCFLDLIQKDKILIKKLEINLDYYAICVSVRVLRDTRRYEK